MKLFKQETILNVVKNLLLFLFLGTVLTFSVRGLPGNPTAADLNSPMWKDNGPFELSPERGRFAIVYSFIENKSLFFPIDIARFAAPDVGYINGHYVSLFAPAISFVVMPGYLIGKMLNMSQVGSFLMISLFAIANAFLIKKTSTKLGADPTAGTILAILFVLGTPAFAYAVSLYQHHISTFLILLAFYALISWDGFLSLALIWFLCAASIPVDYPNLFLMAPIGIAAIGKVIYLSNKKAKLHLSIKPFNIMTFASVLIPLLFFVWFSYNSYGNAFQLSGTVPSVSAIDNNGRPALPKGMTLSTADSYLSPENQHKSAFTFFNPRNILNGFYIHLLSPDRGILIYAPIVLFGLVGMLIALKEKTRYVAVLVGIAGADILLYSMWGDPWGGWAFGSRYMIPAYAVLSIFTAILLTRWRRKHLFLAAFLIVSFYSIVVNTLGAITTSALPPQIQINDLEKISGMVQRYTYQKNWEFLLSGHSKSFVYQTFLVNYISPLQFYQFLMLITFTILGGLLVYFASTEGKGQNV